MAFTGRFTRLTNARYQAEIIAQKLIEEDKFSVFNPDPDDGAIQSADFKTFIDEIRYYYFCSDIVRNNTVENIHRKNMQSLTGVTVTSDKFEKLIKALYDVAATDQSINKKDLVTGLLVLEAMKIYARSNIKTYEKKSKQITAGLDAATEPMEFDEFYSERDIYEKKLKKCHTLMDGLWDLETKTCAIMGLLEIKPQKLQIPTRS